MFIINFNFLENIRKKSPLPMAKSCCKSHTWGTSCSIGRELSDSFSFVSGESNLSDNNCTTTQQKSRLRWSRYSSKTTKTFFLWAKITTAIFTPYFWHSRHLKKKKKKNLPFQLPSNSDSTGKIWNASVYLVVLHQDHTEKRQHSQEVFAEFYSLTWKLFSHQIV